MFSEKSLATPHLLPPSCDEGPIRKCREIEDFHVLPDRYGLQTNSCVVHKASGLAGKKAIRAERKAISGEQE
jgi:hypothetical protein